ncbi:MFS transporter [Kitasatospora misakiensis]|uniref:MFS transporter n=1 Tax=Kitasatospora misakiensis TaxID=67330 RepID=A0ABW0WZ16_9ACTN
MSTPPHSWGIDVPVRLLLLALGTFAVGTDTMVMAGILGPIADDLGVSVTAAGQLVTVFALGYALLAPPLAALTARWPRRRLLLTALAVFGAANALSALAPSYGTLLATRVLAAAGAALYTPTANAVATTLVTPERRGRALATVLGGMTVATALGVPLGTWIGRTDWRPRRRWSSSSPSRPSTSTSPPRSPRPPAGARTG